jgi:hypothetical protein
MVPGGGQALHTHVLEICHLPILANLPGKLGFVCLPSFDHDGCEPCPCNEMNVDESYPVDR